ncbi:hypothetical protein [Bifidobacterium felsineum]|uniref:hypothetical protein n=1 Tax=Bifidobacterium felsineum TaxID=2045440 RepID=UPI001BDDA8EF|nr:hypothetical protein [Bifidobacterium felsineum]MBT1164969.1 hypothetical protein [Bifidobacterium felsineum]
MIDRPRILLLGEAPAPMVNAAAAYQNALKTDPHAPVPPSLPESAAMNIRRSTPNGGLYLDARDMRFDPFHVTFTGDPHAYPIMHGAPLGDGFACGWGLLTMTNGVPRLALFPTPGPDAYPWA